MRIIIKNIKNKNLVIILATQPHHIPGMLLNHQSVALHILHQSLHYLAFKAQVALWLVIGIFFSLIIIVIFY